MRSRLAAWSLAAFLMAGANDLSAADAPPPAPAAMTAPQAMKTVSLALSRVDVPAMAELYQQNPDPVVRVLAAMTLERIHFNLGKSSEDALLCEKELLDKRPQVAFFCAGFANGNLRLSKGSKAAEADALAILRRFQGRVPQADLDALSSFVEQRRGLPEFQLSRPESVVTIPLTKAYGDDRGEVTLEANGESSRMILDTGAGPVVLDEDTAKKLGVRLTGIDGRIGGLLSKGVPTQQGVLDKATFGGITLENVPVEVVQAHRRLIGMDVLRHLGAFHLTKRNLYIYSKTSTRPVCDQPMLVSTSLWGNSVRAVTALSIDGTLRTTLLDSGSAFYLNGNQAAAEQVGVIYNRRLHLSDIGATHAARVSQATADVIVSGQPIKMTFGVFRDVDMPWDYILGSGSLGDMDFFFDFDRHNTCLLLHNNLR
ncbi:retropepsin-like aspartic protease [Dyella subtropica]|uniref:retropepsin-like aspartic protease n=1 Tax=Dyella subtropica TaxID=2992127 RepID=UPI002258799F|nr:retropepsin-like aspartic protease [Dyella subtropica]